MIVLEPQISQNSNGTYIKAYEAKLPYEECEAHLAKYVEAIIFSVNNIKHE